MTPADELRAAAQRVNSLPNASTRGPRWAPRIALPLHGLLLAAADAADAYPSLADPDSAVSRMTADPDQAGAYRHTAALIRQGLALARTLPGATS